jgi:hypothetical protein
MNISFPDPETGQARELDAYCFRGEPSDVQEFFSASMHLLVECVNNPQPVAFFTPSRRLSLYPILAARPAWLGPYPLEESIGIEDFHHSFKVSMATNYCTFVAKKSGEWMVTHADEQHSEFSTLASLAQLTREKQLRMLEEESRPQDAIHLCGVEFIYPILVVEGTLFEVAEDSKRDVTLREINHMRYCKSQIWRGTRRYCPIDVITESFFPQFLKLIIADSKKTLSALEKRADEILEAARSQEDHVERSELEDYLP